LILDFGLGIKIVGVGARRFIGSFNPKSEIKNPKYERT
jgi:hypothetical protein